MDIDTLLKLAGIVATLIGGANFVIIAIARTFWSLTFKAKVENDEKRFKLVEERISKLEKKVDEHEDKNKYFRHNFDSVTKNLETLISSEIKHLGEIIGLQIKNIMEKMNEKK